MAGDECHADSRAVSAGLGIASMAHSRATVAVAVASPAQTPVGETTPASTGPENCPRGRERDPNGRLAWLTIDEVGYTENYRACSPSPKRQITLHEAPLPGPSRGPHTSSSPSPRSAWRCRGTQSARPAAARAWSGMVSEFETVITYHPVGVLRTPPPVTRRWRGRRSRGILDG